MSLSWTWWVWSSLWEAHYHKTEFREPDWAFPWYFGEEKWQKADFQILYRSFTEQPLPEQRYDCLFGHHFKVISQETG